MVKEITVKDVGLNIEKALNNIDAIKDRGIEDDLDLKMIRGYSKMIGKGTQWVKEQTGWHIEETILDSPVESDNYMVLDKEGAMCYSGNFRGALEMIIHICKTI